MTLKDKMTSDMSVFFNADEFASDGWTYTPYTTGVPKSVTVIAFKDGALQEPYVRGKEVASCFVVLQKTEISDFIYRDKMNDGTYDWEFNPNLGVTYEDDDTFILELFRELE